jgi:hypothetical protein
MKIDPTYASVGKLFSYKPMFFIPKYQRAYAWDSESVSDFVKDLKDCFEKRKSGSSINHFFGGILSVKHTVSGVVNQHKYEIIDGQQRIATFTLLGASIIRAYKNLIPEAQSADDTTNERIIKGRIENISERFIEFVQEVQRVETQVQVLELSQADNPFYQHLIREVHSSPSRDSHRKILGAYKALSKTIEEIISLRGRLEEKIDDLEIVQNIIEHDFTILHMVTESREDAYRLFQVINDRGTNLTDGDLLRAKTLEILEGFAEHQNMVEQLWNDILADSPSATGNYLNWIYESHKGKRAKKNALFDLFLRGFFPQYNVEDFSEQDAAKVSLTVTENCEEILDCRKLVGGQWLYDRRQPITGWDISRLNILMVELGHTLSIPLFLAASKLDHRRFSEIVQLVEKAFFRYKLICNKHVSLLKNIYYEEALSIRQSPTTYQVSSLQSRLHDLIASQASDVTFKNSLATLEYKETGGSNKPLKYFLMTVEYFYLWYKQGAVGMPVCVDKSRVYDFASTSIEHVYPRNAAGNVYNADLEQLKDSLGNLTIMDPEQNKTGGNDSFAMKRQLYRDSSVLFTQDIGAKTAWTRTEIDQQKDLLLEIAVKIFQI